MSKIIKYLSALLLIVSAIIAVVFYVNTNDATVYLMINWALILLVVSIVSAVVLPIFFTDGRGSKSSLIKVGIMLGLCVLSYLMASSEPSPNLSLSQLPSAQTFKLTDAGIILTAILLTCSIIAIVASAVSNIIKNR